MESWVSELLPFYPFAAVILIGVLKILDDRRNNAWHNLLQESNRLAKERDEANVKALAAAVASFKESAGMVEDSAESISYSIKDLNAAAERIVLQAEKLAAVRPARVISAPAPVDPAPVPQPVSPALPDLPQKLIEPLKIFHAFVGDNKEVRIDELAEGCPQLSFKSWRKQLDELMEVKRVVCNKRRVPRAYKPVFYYSMAGAKLENSVNLPKACPTLENEGNQTPA